MPDGKTVRGKFECPFVEDTDWEHSILNTLRMKSFNASEIKIAESYDGDKDKLNKVLGEYSSHGAGQYLGSMQMVDFDNDVRNMIWKRRRVDDKPNPGTDL